MVNWLRFPVYHVTENEDGFHVRILDVRYSRSPSDDPSIGLRHVWLTRDLEPRAAPSSAETQRQE